MNSSVKVLNYKNVKKNKYHYNIAKKTNYNSYISGCVYKLSNSNCIPFLYESPRLKTTSGIYKHNGNFYMDLEVPLESSATEKTFYDFLVENDEVDIITSFKNCKEWFGNALPMDIIKDYYKSSLILGTEGRNPVLKVKIPSYRGKIMIEIYNQDKELVNPDYINPGDELISLIEKVGLEFLSKEFLSEYQIHKIKVFKNNYYPDVKVPSGYLFSDKTYINMNKLPSSKDIVKVDSPPLDHEDEDDIGDEIKVINEDDVPFDLEPKNKITVNKLNEMQNIEEIEKADLTASSDSLEKTIELTIGKKDIIVDKPILPNEDNDDIALLVKEEDTINDLIKKVEPMEVEVEPVSRLEETKSDVKLPKGKIELTNEQVPEKIPLIKIPDEINEEYYSDSEYEIDDEDLINNLVDLSNKNNTSEVNEVDEVNENQEILNMIKKKEQELLNLKNKLMI